MAISNNNLDIGIRITADSSNAVSNVNTLNTAIGNTGQAASNSSTGVNALSEQEKKAAEEAAKANAAFNAQLSDLTHLSQQALTTGKSIDALGFSFTEITEQASKFEAKMAEVTTLLTGKSLEAVPMLTKSVRDLAMEYGGTAAEQAQALYQVISSGAATAADGNINAAKAVGLLDIANKLAVGGVTDVTTAIDGLTNAYNVFAKDGELPIDIANSFFIAMRDGKTTIKELSENIGIASPLWKAAGGSLQDLMAGVTALTLAGNDTSVAMTQMRSMVKAIIDPSKEAMETAANLGLEFSSAALQTKGLAGFLADLKEKTGGSEEVLAKLFGRVEGLSAALALTGTAAIQFANTLQNQIDRTGAADAAFEKMAATNAVAMERFKSAMVEIQIAMGNVFLPSITGGIKGITDFIKANETFVSSLASALTVMGGLAGGVGVAYGAYVTLNLMLQTVTTTFTTLSVAAVALPGQLAAMSAAAEAGTLSFGALGLSLKTLTPVISVIVAVGATLPFVIAAFSGEAKKASTASDQLSEALKTVAKETGLFYQSQEELMLALKRGELYFDTAKNQYVKVTDAVVEFNKQLKEAKSEYLQQSANLDVLSDSLERNKDATNAAMSLLKSGTDARKAQNEILGDEAKSLDLVTEATSTMLLEKRAALSLLQQELSLKEQELEAYNKYLDKDPALRKTNKAEIEELEKNVVVLKTKVEVAKNVEAIVQANVIKSQLAAEAYKLENKAVLEIIDSSANLLQVTNDLSNITAKYKVELDNVISAFEKNEKTYNDVIQATGNYIAALDAEIVGLENAINKTKEYTATQESKNDLIQKELKYKMDLDKSRELETEYAKKFQLAAELEIDFTKLKIEKNQELIFFINKQIDAATKKANIDGVVTAAEQKNIDSYEKSKVAIENQIKALELNIKVKEDDIKANSVLIGSIKDSQKEIEHRLNLLKQESEIVKTNSDIKTKAIEHDITLSKLLLEDKDKLIELETQKLKVETDLIAEQIKQKNEQLKVEVELVKNKNSLAKADGFVTDQEKLSIETSLNAIATLQQEINSLEQSKKQKQELADVSKIVAQASKFENEAILSVIGSQDKLNANTDKLVGLIQEESKIYKELDDAIFVTLKSKKEIKDIEDKLIDVQAKITQETSKYNDTLQPLNSTISKYNIENEKLIEAMQSESAASTSLNEAQKNTVEGRKKLEDSISGYKKVLEDAKAKYIELSIAEKLGYESGKEFTSMSDQRTEAFKNMLSASKQYKDAVSELNEIQKKDITTKEQIIDLEQEQAIAQNNLQKAIKLYQDELDTANDSTKKYEDSLKSAKLHLEELIKIENSGIEATKEFVKVQEQIIDIQKQIQDATAKGGDISGLTKQLDELKSKQSDLTKVIELGADASKNKANAEREVAEASYTYSKALDAQVKGLDAQIDASKNGIKVKEDETAVTLKGINHQIEMAKARGDDTEAAILQQDAIGVEVDLIDEQIEQKQEQISIIKQQITAREKQANIDGKVDAEEQKLINTLKSSVNGLETEIDSLGVDRQAKLDMAKANSVAEAAAKDLGEAIQRDIDAIDDDINVSKAQSNAKIKAIDNEIALAEAKGDTAKVSELQKEKLKLEIEEIDKEIEAKKKQAELTRDLAEAKKQEAMADGVYTDEEKAQVDAIEKSADAMDAEVASLEEDKKAKEQALEATNKLVKSYVSLEMALNQIGGDYGRFTQEVRDSGQDIDEYIKIFNETFSETMESLKKMQAAFSSPNAYQYQNWLDEAARLSAQAVFNQKNLNDAIADIEKTMDKAKFAFDNGQMSLAEYLSELQRLEAQYHNLDDTQLDALKDEIKSVEDQTRSLTQTVAGELKDSLEELGIMTLEDAKLLEDLAYEQKKFELEQQAIQAKGNAELEAMIQRVMDLNEKAHQKRLENLEVEYTKKKETDNEEIQRIDEKDKKLDKLHNNEVDRYYVESNIKADDHTRGLLMIDETDAKLDSFHKNEINRIFERNRAVLNTPQGGSSKDVPSGLTASTGADFIVPPGYPDDTFPLFVESGEHVKVTPANKSPSTAKDQPTHFAANGANFIVPDQNRIISLSNELLNLGFKIESLPIEARRLLTSKSQAENINIEKPVIEPSPLPVPINIEKDAPIESLITENANVEKPIIETAPTPELSNIEKTIDKSEYEGELVEYLKALVKNAKNNQYIKAADGADFTVPKSWFSDFEKRWYESQAGNDSKFNKSQSDILSRGGNDEWFKEFSKKFNQGQSDILSRGNNDGWFSEFEKRWNQSQAGNLAPKFASGTLDELKDSAEKIKIQQEIKSLGENYPDYGNENTTLEQWKEVVEKIKIQQEIKSLGENYPDYGEFSDSLEHWKEVLEKIKLQKEIAPKFASGTEDLERQVLIEKAKAKSSEMEQYLGRDAESLPNDQSIENLNNYINRANAIESAIKSGLKDINFSRYSTNELNSLTERKNTETEAQQYYDYLMPLLGQNHSAMNFRGSFNDKNTSITELKKFNERAKLLKESHDLGIWKNRDFSVNDDTESLREQIEKIKLQNELEQLQKQNKQLKFAKGTGNIENGYFNVPDGYDTNNKFLMFVESGEHVQVMPKNKNTDLTAATGADFIVPPGYPNDSFRLGVQSGEHVQVTPPGQNTKIDTSGLEDILKNGLQKIIEATTKTTQITLDGKVLARVMNDYQDRVGRLRA